MDPQLYWPIITRGYEGHPEQTVELLLRAQALEVEELAGFADLTYQDSYDSVVVAGIEILQRVKGLTVDGVIGPATWPKLVITVEMGDEGDAVKAVQEENQFRNMADSEEATGLYVDGIFGPKTRSWVKGFQTACELIPDGVVGKKTWRALVVGMYAG